MNSLSDDPLFQFSQAASLLAGCTLFAIGISSSLGYFLQPVAQISFLIAPLGFDPRYDQAYWVALTLVGLWLVTFFGSRLAAMTALILIGLKWVVLTGVV